ncbi:MAG: LysM peptidoglycan-binding domain-containing protein [Caldilineaceae bacterium]
MNGKGVITVLIALLCTAILAGQSVRTLYAQDDSGQEPTGYEYTVQRGDNWASVAARTGVTVAELKEANPDSIRYSGWLITGEKLFIPASKPLTFINYTVQAGDSWSVIAKEHGIKTALLKALNSRYVRAGDVLYRGDVLTIPLTEETAAAMGITAEPADTTATAATPTTTAGEAAIEATAAEETAGEASPATATSAAATPQATVAETATPANEEEEATPTPATPEASADQAASPTATTATEAGALESTDTETTTVAAAPAPACPADFADYPLAILQLVNASTAANVDDLTAFLDTCGATTATSVTAQDLTGDGVDDLVVIYQNSATQSPQPVMDLLILDSSASGYTIGHQARAESEVNLLALVDLNSDGQSDVAWLERTCGASSCFDTVQIYSWDGTTWRNWTAEKITMANASVELKDVLAEGQGFEVILSGGQINSDGAGRQRDRVENWGSVDGAPYILLQTTYADSTCLYHLILDANTAFLNGGADEFAKAEELYTKAISDNALVACGTRENELDELRSFGLYRLALVAAYEGQPDVAGDFIESIAATYPTSPYSELGAAWLARYRQDYDLPAACAVATQFAEDNPAAVDLLNSFGYANPSFSAAEVCPVLDAEIPPPPTPAPTPTASDTSGDNTSEDNTDESSAAGSEVVASSAANIESTDATTATNTQEAAAEEIAATDGDASSSVELPACPADLAGYAETLPTLLTLADQDGAKIESWLRSCDALDDERGSFKLTDLNGDGLQDAIFLPTIVSDLGFGPNGAQGAILIYHQAADGVYTLAASPEVYGQPQLLTAEDLNADGKADIAWTVTGCSTFCVLEVQIVEWANGVYTSTILPGATITQGEAHFTAIDSTDPGQGKQLVLTGGVSNEPDGGLAVPHTEIWQSIDHKPFQRIRWTYDRTVDGSDCLGLRLVEADVVLQAASVLGYQPAIDLYTQSLDPALKACSIFNLANAEELPLLRGLANFRLIQAQALAGDFVAAGQVMQSLSQSQPESGYTKAAETWLDSYESEGDATVACTKVQPIFNDNSTLWQITDHFGYNHPALAAEQICYVP